MCSGQSTATFNSEPGTITAPPSPPSKLNCEVLHDELAFEVRWAVAGDSIVVQLVAKLEDGEYMSFGVSGSANHSQMVGADVAVAWVDKSSLQGQAQDYYLDAKSQCAGVRGSCPDERLGEKTNSIRLLNAALVNGYSIVTYQRSLKAADQLDLAVPTGHAVPVVWALGPLNSRNEVSYHHHYTKEDRFIEFGRPPVWNCPMPEGEEDTNRNHTAPTSTKHPEHIKPTTVIKPNPVPTPKPAPKAVPWEIPAIQCYEPPDGVFYAQMGPTGGKQGYPAITGHVGWGISWYINGLLIPEINVVRGRKYTFVVEGGADPDVPARYHPFYVTDDSVGGYLHRTDDEKKNIKIFAGVRRSRGGSVVPSGVGRLCNWTPQSSGPDADEFPSFGAYQRSLTLVCEEGSPGVVTWTPDSSTPDTVYYQCFTHRYLGWKINVLDECDATGEESQVSEIVALPEDDQVQEESIQVQSRVRPGVNFLDRQKKVEKIINTKTNYNDFSKIQGDAPNEYRPESQQEIELPISKGQIKNVIEAIESLQTHMAEGVKRTQTPPPLHASTRTPQQYAVYEDVKESFLQEQPVHEDDEYTVGSGKVPENYFLPPNQKPLTLQSVLKPFPMTHNGNLRPPFRRPVPPEILIRRPPPPSMFQKHNYPLSLPNYHSHNMQNKYNKPQFNRGPFYGDRPLPIAGSSPMKAMPPLHHNKPSLSLGPPKHMSKQPVQSIIIGKPNPTNLPMPVPTQSQTLSLGKTDIIANQVVKSQIILPGSSDSIVQSSVQHSFISQPGQIILGKPMDNPVPLDQQMAPTNDRPFRVPIIPPPEPKSTTFRLRIPNVQTPETNLKTSDFIGEYNDTSTMPPAVNTGFKPNTIVVESGFKPIIREPLMDRIGDYTDGASSNRREDTDVEENYDFAPQDLKYSEYQYSRPSNEITQSFEPMFIPSPEDHLLPTNDITKEVFPSNHAKEDRPHPVYVKTETELNSLFSIKNMDKEVPADMVMDSDRVSPQYLPPVSAKPKEHSQKLFDGETFTTYDGKIISAATLTSISDTNSGPKLFSSKLPSNTELLLKSPQFGPFKGEIPIEITGQMTQENKKEAIKETNVTRTTHLKLVNTYKLRNENDMLEEAGSENKEQVLVVTEKDKEKKENETSYDDLLEEYYVENEEEDVNKRRKRDTKATHFEEGEVEQTPELNGSSTKNQIDFHVQTNKSTKVHFCNFLIITLCLKLI